MNGSMSSSGGVHGGMQAVRAPVGLAVVKVLGLVPEEDRRAALPGVLQTIANLLKARHQGVRCVHAST